jgi:hypothetical protein
MEEKKEVKKESYGRKEGNYGRKEASYERKLCRNKGRECIHTHT